MPQLLTENLSREDSARVKSAQDKRRGDDAIRLRELRGWWMVVSSEWTHRACNDDVDGIQCPLVHVDTIQSTNLCDLAPRRSFRACSIAVGGDWTAVSALSRAVHGAHPVHAHAIFHYLHTLLARTRRLHRVPTYHRHTTKWFQVKGGQVQCHESGALWRLLLWSHACLFANRNPSKLGNAALLLPSSTIF